MTSDESVLFVHHTSTTHYFVLHVQLTTEQMDLRYHLILRVTLIRGTPMLTNDPC